MPGGPTSSTPLGMRAPTAVNLSGFFRNSTTCTGHQHVSQPFLCTMPVAKSHCHSNIAQAEDM